MRDITGEHLLPRRRLTLGWSLVWPPRTIETQRNCPGGVGRDTADLPCIVPASRMRGHRSVGQLRFPIASALASRSERSPCLARMEQRGQLSLPGDLSSTEAPSRRVVIAHSARVCCCSVTEARSPEEEEEEEEMKRRCPRVSLVIILGSTAIHAASMPRPMGISTSQYKHTPTTPSERLSLSLSLLCHCLSPAVPAAMLLFNTGRISSSSSCCMMVDLSTRYLVSCSLSSTF